MATPTYLQLTTLSSNANGLQPESMEERILSVLAILASGQNPDGTGNTAVPASSLTRRATTGTAGVALINATQVVLTWTAPNDGNLHTVYMSVYESVTAAETGGATGYYVNNVSSTTVATQQISAGSLAVANYIRPIQAVVLLPGYTVQIVQTSALTAGACTYYAEIWAS